MTLRTLVDEIYLKITQDLTVESYNGIIKYTTSSGEYLEKNIGNCSKSVGEIALFQIALLEFTGL